LSDKKLEVMQHRKKTWQLTKFDHYLLNGTKTGLQMVQRHQHLVIAQTDIEKGHKGINAFMSSGWAGFDIGPKERKWEFVEATHIR
jgi:alkylation response protein AidB-like acyl-CoA dehydrogenase